jgi:hypothetical protein
VLVVVATLKIASAGWRFLRSYGRNRPYRQAGPPPLLLRILGPFVVLATVAVLGTGLWLIAVGPESGHTLVTVLGQRIDLLSLHQASFIVFAVAAGLHLLARFVPAVVLATERGHRDDGRLRGRGPRIAVLVAALVAGALAAALILPAAAPWRNEQHGFPGGPPPGFSHG